MQESHGEPVNTTVLPPTDNGEHRRGALLDTSTLTGAGPSRNPYFHSGWAVSIHEGTGEASIRFHSPARNLPSGIRGEGSEHSDREADARARRNVRRYCVVNGLDRLVTLTYAPEHLPEDWDGVWADIDSLRRNLRSFLKGRSIPILATIERGEKGGRLHVHLAIGQYIPAPDLERCWGKGFIDIRKVRVMGEGKRARCRAAAHYVSKYVTKADSHKDGRSFNGRRYSTTKGFQYVTRSTLVGSFDDAWHFLLGEALGPVEWTWWSGDDEEWRGPPVLAVRFGD